MYTLDYNFNRNAIEVLFFHGTSSANIDNILQVGLIRPDLDAVIDHVLEAAPHLQRFRNDFLVDQARPGPLAIEARRFDANAHAWAWLGNTLGLAMVQGDVRAVVPHGGEIYAVVHSRISQFAEAYELAAPEVRFPDATPYLIAFTVLIPLHNRANVGADASHNFYDTVLDNISDPSFDEYFGGPVPVRFTTAVPPDRIIWHGPLTEFTGQLEGLMSPAANIRFRK